MNPFGEAPLDARDHDQGRTDYAASYAAIHAVARDVYAYGFRTRRSAAHLVAARDGVEGLEAPGHLAEDRVLAVEKTRVGEANVKLRTGAVGIDERAMASVPRRCGRALNSALSR